MKSPDELKQERVEVRDGLRRAVIKRAGNLRGEDLRGMAILTRCVTNPGNLMSDDQIVTANLLLDKLGL